MILMDTIKVQQKVLKQTQNLNEKQQGRAGASNLKKRYFDHFSFGF
jgi:hypothetical protein